MQKIVDLSALAQATKSMKISDFKTRMNLRFSNQMKTKNRGIVG